MNKISISYLLFNSQCNKVGKTSELIQGKIIFTDFITVLCMCMHNGSKVLCYLTYIRTSKN